MPRMILRGRVIRTPACAVPSRNPGFLSCLSPWPDYAPDDTQLQKGNLPAKRSGHALFLQTICNCIDLGVCTLLSSRSPPPSADDEDAMRLLTTALLLVAWHVPRPARPPRRKSSRRSPPSPSSPTLRRTWPATPRSWNRSPSRTPKSTITSRRRGDILRAQDADLILWNGLNLEQWFEQLLQQYQRRAERRGFRRRRADGHRRGTLYRQAQPACLDVARGRADLCREHPQGLRRSTTRRMPKSTTATPPPIPRRSRRRSSRSGRRWPRSPRKGAGWCPAKALSAIWRATSA